jgi:hypothetical protein
VFNTTFSNISAISWRPVLVVEEAGVPGENHRPWASNWSTLSLAAASRVHPFCNLQSRVRTHPLLNSLSHPGPLKEKEQKYQKKITYK